MQRGTNTNQVSNGPVGSAAEADYAAVMRDIQQRLSFPIGAKVAENLIYAVGFIRTCGGVEDAEAVDRAGSGKIHKHGDRRADATASYFQHWMTYGATGVETRKSVAEVARMHEHYKKSYTMSNAAFVHGVALFTILFDEIFQIVGLDAFTEEEKAAQVAHWRAIGEQLGAHDMPDTWAGLRQSNFDYEHNPEYFRPTPEAHRCAEALIDQFNNRWLPLRLHPLGRALLLSLVPDHVLVAVGEPKPPAVVVFLLRTAVRFGLLAEWRIGALLRRFRLMQAG
ncbi:oxygenase MpaB family protein [Nocardia amamiensis]|uniref:oxygenase MpaB family protein n=1 Tax=Nocardia amamiensis TaxID=404578 RepID=UPI0034000851